MKNTHRVDFWTGEKPNQKWVPFTAMPSLEAAVHKATLANCTARVVEIETGTTVAGWNSGKRVKV